MKPAAVGGWPALVGVPKDLAEEAIDEADQVFAHVLEFVGERIDKRREYACWWAIVHAGIIRGVNRRRAERGLRPRAMLLRTRWLIRAEAMCEANQKADPRLAVVCRAVHQRMADLGVAPERTT